MRLDALGCLLPVALRGLCCAAVVRERAGRVRVRVCPLAYPSPHQALCYTIDNDWCGWCGRVKVWDG